MALLKAGLTNEQIAARLRISLSTVKYHVSDILVRLDASTRAEAVEKLADRSPRPQPSFGWPFVLSLRRLLPWFAVLFAGSLVTVALVLLAKGGDGGHRPDLTANDAGVALDVGSQEDPVEVLEATPAPPVFPNTVLMTKSEPANVGDASDALAGVVHVSTVAELEAALGPNVNLVIVDQSALDEVRGTDLLARQLAAERWVMGLNISNVRLREVTDFEGVLGQRGLEAAAGMAASIREPGDSGAGYYSLLRVKPENASANPSGVVFTQSFGGEQLYFFEERFLADLTALDDGDYRQAANTWLPLYDLPEERIWLNEGMGCTYDHTKTAAAVKRELIKTHADVLVSDVIVAFCVPEASGEVTLGAQLSTIMAEPQTPVSVVCPTPESGESDECLRPTPVASMEERGPVRVVVSVEELLP